MFSSIIVIIFKYADNRKVQALSREGHTEQKTNISLQYLGMRAFASLQCGHSYFYYIYQGSDHSQCSEKW